MEGAELRALLRVLRQEEMAVRASERLRELDANRRYWPPNSGQRELYEHSIADALPLIADVVEAAEEMADWLEMQSSNIYGRDLIPIIRFDSYLTALRDALERP